MNETEKLFLVNGKKIIIIKNALFPFIPWSPVKPIALLENPNLSSLFATSHQTKQSPRSESVPRRPASSPGAGGFSFPSLSRFCFALLAVSLSHAICSTDLEFNGDLCLGSGRGEAEVAGGRWTSGTTVSMKKRNLQDGSAFRFCWWSLTVVFQAWFVGVQHRDGGAWLCLCSPFS